MLATYGEVVQSVNRGFVVDMIFLDFSRAIDVVNHSIMLTKLRILGIGGEILSWICEFLSGRTMSTKVAGKMSSLKQITSNAPEGSVLGPVLFFIYVNFIANSVQFQWNSFADGFKLYLSFPQNTCIPILQGMILLQSDLDRVGSVAKSWNLRFNISKCVALRFGSYLQYWQ